MVRKHATVYDAVAGRVGADGFIKHDAIPSKHRDTISKPAVPIRPDEVLFKTKNAPERFEEDDIYRADEQLGPHQKLPDSDLLKALHVYASEFYANNTTGKAQSRTWRSMDETALLAMGILMEEAGREILGETGDMVFVEADDHDEHPSKRVWNGTTWVDDVLDRSNRQTALAEHDRLQGTARQRKRRRSTRATAKAASRKDSDAGP